MSDSATLAAAKRAKQIMGAPFVIVDCETTGFSGYSDEIVQIAILAHNYGVLLDTLVKPRQPIYNSHIHGITDEMVADAPTFPEVYSVIAAALSHTTVLAFNYSFDHSMILGNCKQHNLPIPPIGDGDCIMKLFARFFGEWNYRRKSYTWKSLEVAAAHFELPYSKKHAALADAQMALNVLRKMADWHDAQAR